MKTRAAVLWGVGQDWKVEEIDLDPPKAGEVLVKMAAAGLCHSDEHAVTGDMAITEEMAAEMAATGYEFKPPGHARTKSVRDLYGWQSGETLEQAIAGQQRRQCLSS